MGPTQIYVTTAIQLHLHQASFKGFLEVARLLLSYEAVVNEKDGKDMTPFQVATRNGHCEIAKLLSEHGTMLNAAPLRSSWTSCRLRPPIVAFL